MTATTPVAKDDITNLGIPAQDTTYDEATTAKAGLMSAADKTKLDGMGATINKAIGGPHGYRCRGVRDAGRGIRRVSS